MGGLASRMARRAMLGHLDLEARAARKAALAGDRVREAQAAGERAAARALRQARLDDLLPAFLTGDPLHPLVGSHWVTLADLSLLEEDDRPAGFIFDLAPSASAAARAVLPRGSTLRLLDPFWDMWGYGYLAGILFDLAVEDGPLAGQTVMVVDNARHSGLNGLPRRTLAAALIVPADDPAAHDVGLARARYDQLVEILRDAVPHARSDGMRIEPVSLPSDLAAIGFPSGGLVA